MGLPALGYAALGAIGIGGASMFGGGDDDEAPPINRTEYAPKEAADKFKPINALKWFDAVTGEEFNFIRDLDGNVSVNLNSDRNDPVDAPIHLNNLNLNLPDVPALKEFTNKYAGKLANLTMVLRELGDTMAVMETTAPELIPHNIPMINSYKEASKIAMNKGFNIKQNGLDKRLQEMGLSKSSTAIGAQIALSRDWVDTEINNIFQTQQLAQGLKQQSLANYYKLGNQIVQEAGIELNKYTAESGNELTARSQDLGRESLVQNRAVEQARLNFSNEQMRVNTELARRNLRAGLLQSRNPTNAAMNLLSNNNNTALAAVQGDNTANYQKNLAELEHGKLEIGRFQANQAAQSNPLLEMGMMAANAYAGNVAGVYGTAHGAKLAGVDPKELLLAKQKKKEWYE